ncbi:hypothetical protein [Paenibacillus periandrae]|uniref:hypothetical protein n=1 Tax=Paenibacillus periandrae TaxID=1761741 RepID=UPI001F0998D4|nr:hypothetical protein [Paenibacillus periandrae]
MNIKKISVSFMIFSTICLGIIAYPTTYAIQKAIPSIQPFSGYMKMLEYLADHKTLCFVILLTVLFTGSKQLYAITAKEIKLRHLDLEVQRWNFTPYIAPLHLYYMFFPQQSYIKSNRAIASDFTYRTTVDHFRNRIYYNANYNTFEPNKRPSLFLLIGPKIIAEIIGYFVAFMFSLVTLLNDKPISEWDSDWHVFAIPVLIFLIRRVYYLIKSVMDSGVRYNHVEKFFNDNYGEKEPRIKWHELYPNQQIGATILDVWKKECEIRQRLYDQSYNRGENKVLIFDCPSLPERPFTEEDIPEWAEGSEEHYEIMKEEWEVRKRMNTTDQLPPKLAANPKVIFITEHKKRKC